MPQPSQPTRGGIQREDGVDHLEPLLSAEEAATGDRVDAEGDNNASRIAPTDRSRSGAAIEPEPEEECSPVGRSFLGPMLGRSNLRALTACALFAACYELYRMSAFHHILV
jgi:hypothetical protein